MTYPKRARSSAKIAALVDRSRGDIGLPRGQFDFVKFDPAVGQPVAAISGPDISVPSPDIDGQFTALDDPSIVPSADGKLDNMLVTIPDYIATIPGEDNDIATIYRNMFAESKRRNIRLVVLAQQGGASVVRGWLDQAGIDDAELGIAPYYLGFSIWAQDPYVSLQVRSDQTYLVQPFAFPRAADGELAANITQFTDLNSYRVPLYFQGGNILTGDNFFAIGADYPVRSLRYINSYAINLDVPDPTRNQRYNEILDLYRKTLDWRRELLSIGSSRPVLGENTMTFTLDGKVWTEVTNVGNSRDVIPTVQPMFHIDMFVTLLGRPELGGAYRVAVGDPRLAESIIQRVAPDYRLPPFAMPEIFDDIAAQFAAQGFEVTRLPLPLIYMDDDNTLNRRWYFATYNNAIVQFSRSEHVDNFVWMPAYGYQPWDMLQATDEASAEIYRNLGFDVTTLGNCQALAESLGALHCIVKYLRRTDTLTPTRPG